MATYEMTIDDNGFSPKKIDVKRGDVVKFINTTSSTQTVNIDADSLFGCLSVTVDANSPLDKTVQQGAQTMTYTVTDVAPSEDKGMLGDPPGKTGEIEVRD